MDTSNNHRYIPVSETDEQISQLNLARIETTKGYLNNNSHGELPSSEDPFNPILSYDVKYYEPRLQQRNRVLTKYENKANETNDIALYNTRTHALNAEDVVGLDNLEIHKNQMERARGKVQQRYESFVPQENSNPNVFNGNIYNPQLPISPTNQPTRTYKAAEVDERLGWYTNGREFRYPSDIANNAYNLQRSPEIIERNRRQADADDALYHRHQKSRWVEPKQAYRDRAYLPNYSLDEFVKHDKSKSNDRQLGNLERENFNLTVKAKHNHLNDIEHINQVKADVQQSFNPEYNRRQIQQTMKRFNDSRDPNANRSGAVEAFEPGNTKSGLFETIANKLFDTITDSLGVLLGLNKNKKQKLVDEMNKRDMYDETRRGLPINTTLPYDEVFDKARENFGFKPQHLLIARDGSIPAVFPDEDYSNTAPAFIMRDPFDGGISRTIVIVEDAKFKIIQKHEADKVFSGDGRPYAEDYIISEIPIEELPTQMREKIRKQNMDTGRDKALELTYDDFISFNDYVLQHIDTADRIKFADIWKKIRGNDFDEQLVNNFEGRRTLVDSSAVQDAVAEVRKNRLHETLNERQYSQHEQLAPIEQNDVNIMRMAPMSSAALPSSGEAFRPVQVNSTPFATKRTNGVNMKRFNL